MTYGNFDLDSVHEHVHAAGEPFYGLRATSRFIEAYYCDLNPDYQRDHVWTVDQQQKFIGFLLEGGWISPCIINCGPKGDWLYGDKEKVGKSEVIDGKQRITAALQFERGEIKAELSDGRLVHISDMDAKSRIMLGNTVGLCYKIVYLSRPEALKLYIKLNRGGTIHTDAEINKVRRLLEKEQQP
jgi:hypothetical protein